MPKSPNQKSPQLSRIAATPNVTQFLNLDIKHIKMPTKVFNPVKPIQTSRTIKMAVPKRLPTSPSPSSTVEWVSVYLAHE